MTTHKNNSNYGTVISDSTLNISRVDLNAINQLTKARFPVLHNLSSSVDGSNRIFNLNPLPDDNFLHMLMVYIDGAFQQISTYTLYANRTAIEFVAAPSAGAELLISYIEERD